MKTAISVTEICPTSNPNKSLGCIKFDKKNFMIDHEHLLVSFNEHTIFIPIMLLTLSHSDTDLYPMLNHRESK